MTQTPPDGKRDHATHEQPYDDTRLRALRDILTILAHGVAQKIHDGHQPTAGDDADPSPPPDATP